MSTWMKMLDREKKDRGDNSKVVYSTVCCEELNREFHSGYGGVEGTPFVHWTEDRVYFCVMYDGSEQIGSVPRNPTDDEKIDHFGG